MTLNDLWPLSPPNLYSPFFFLSNMDKIDTKYIIAFMGVSIATFIFLLCIT